MKKYFLLTTMLFANLFLMAQVDLINKVKNNQSKAAKEGFHFTTIINIETTPVKNQGASGTCWSYSSNSFLETEMLRKKHKVIDLAEMFTVRNTYEEKADRYVRMHGNLNFGQGGALPDVITMYRNYGAVPQEVYPGLNYGTKINRHGELDAVLKGMLDAIIENKNKKLTPVWRTAISKVLDVYLGDYPKHFTYEGKRYTPQSFAKEYVGLDPDDYLQFTSWKSNPYYKEMMVLVPDNWHADRYYNVPMEDMIDIFDTALKNGYSISWAVDVSEKYFSWKNGVAYVPEKTYREMSREERKSIFDGPQPERKITEEMRQESFDNYTTTDDHGMQIVGLAKDQNGTEYYIVKNSWGTGNDYDGYIYMSKNYARYKTLSFMVNKKALSKKTARKLGL